MHSTSPLKEQYKVANPALEKFSERLPLDRFGTAGVMTLAGTQLRTLVLVLMVLGFGTLSYIDGMLPPGAVGPLALVGFGVSLVIGFTLPFKPEWSPLLAPIYAAGEGLVLGLISRGFDLKYPGLVAHAIVGTLATLLFMLLLYRGGVIRVTEKFIYGMLAAMVGIVAVYILDLVLALFHVRLPVVNDHSGIGIAFSCFVVVVAALNFVLDFHMIEEGVRNRSPKYMEWYGAFGLVLTLVWLYLELLRLLAKLRSDD
jgi:uncharacterized YccA/Bax inhibitor family protein